MNKKNFGQMMKTFSEVFEKELNPYTTKVYFKMFAEIPDSQVGEITMNCLRKCKYFPRPADVFEMISEAPEKHVVKDEKPITKEDIERGRIEVKKIKDMLEGKFEMPGIKEE